MRNYWSIITGHSALFFWRNTLRIKPLRSLGGISFEISSFEDRHDLRLKYAYTFERYQFFIHIKLPGVNKDAFVKNLFCPIFVIPAKAGIQVFWGVMDSRFRGSDGILTFYEIIKTWQGFFKSNNSSDFRMILNHFRN